MSERYKIVSDSNTLTIDIKEGDRVIYHLECNNVIHYHVAYKCINAELKGEPYERTFLNPLS